MTRLLPLVSLLLLLLAPAVTAQTLPGFGAAPIASTNGRFLTSLVIDSRGRIFYTTQDGGIFRIDGAVSIRIATVETAAISDSGLLGMALRNDRTAVVHYTDPGLTEDLLADVDLLTGAITPLATFICDITLPGRACSGEHHGGNPTIAPDGAVFFGIGDYNGRISDMPQWNGGKIWRVGSDGAITQYARGFRNPFDMIWDTTHNRLVTGDNGVLEDDEIDYVTAGGFYGWPQTSGNAPQIADSIPPVYVWPSVVAPTGMTGLHGRNELFPTGMLVGNFKKSLDYFPSFEPTPLPDPIVVYVDPDSAIIDVTEAANGDLYFGTAFGIYRLTQPRRGDCDGNGLLDYADYVALQGELADGPHPRVTAQDGSYRGSWGCDANGDGTIDASDSASLLHMLTTRVRAAKH